MSRMLVATHEHRPGLRGRASPPADAAVPGNHPPLRIQRAGRAGPAVARTGGV